MITTEQAEKAVRDNWGNKAAAARSLNVTRHAIRWALERRKATNENQDTVERGPEFRKELPESRIYVITSAQNATPPHKKFLAALLNYCKHRKAELVIVPIRYRNPTSQWTGKDESVNWWHESLVPHMLDARVVINENLMLLGDIKIQPTAVNPLTSLDSISGHMSAVIGHPKLALKTVPTPGHRLPKILTTTGSVTLKNYTDSRAGKSGEFHHTLGAAVVEVEDNKIFHLRQINAKRDGSFIEWDLACSHRGVKKAGRAALLHLGDTHVAKIDPLVDRATFDNGGIVDQLRPRYIAHNDTLDFYSANHHHRGNPFVQLAKYLDGQNSVFEELKAAARFLTDRTPRNTKNVIVSSNHDEALARWVREADWKSDPANALTYLETALAMAMSAKMLPGKDSFVIEPFHYWLKKLLPRHILKRTIMLRLDESFEVCDIEVGFHGHYGANGARGSRQSFKRIGSKSIIGHGHAPGIDESCYQSGTSAILDREFVKGLSGHLNAHTVIYANGKRSLIIIVGGKYKI